MVAASSSSSLIILFCFLFTLLFISEAVVPPSETFRYVNEGFFGDSEETSIEYDPVNYRTLPPFTAPFALCFYNTTPNAYTLALRMGIRPDRSLRRWVWEANRGHPVRENATFSFRSDGNLVLADADGRIVWQTNTANKGVVGFALLPNGNMVLRDAAGGFVWQSFDSPTDTLLYGQSLRVGGPNKLVSRASVTENVDGDYSFVLEPKRLALYYKKTMLYWSSTFPEVNKASGGLVNATLEIAEAEYSDGNYNSLRCRFANSSAEPTVLLGTNRYNSTFSYLRLGIDGNLRLYGYRRGANAAAWNLLYTWFNREWRNSLEGIEDECQLPDRCGKFGLCEDSQCVGCPTPKGVFAWSKDCVAKSPGCQASGFRYYEVKGVDHFTVKYSAGTGPVKREDCESKCTKDCKCLGYFYHTDRSRCWIAYELKTLTRVENSTHIAYIKTPRSKANRKSKAEEKAGAKQTSEPYRDEEGFVYFNVPILHHKPIIDLGYIHGCFLGGYVCFSIGIRGKASVNYRIDVGSLVCVRVASVWLFPDAKWAKWVESGLQVEKGDILCSKDCKCMGYFYHTDPSRCWIAYNLKMLTRVGNSTNLANMN
ncbi:hypothetical protein OSB04_008508 [Centaurea solstitialis]|uniref:Bulb-type lectin domain-containing protein n=1 Tax=Centaurea solstitialis TaxID=347529 RepID=A0AA38U6F7_9ASTR|nr:hypothetical protein OSB04_008508 [Centaurea solstitialis]